MSRTEQCCLIITGGSLDLSFAEQFLKGRRYDCVIAVDGGLKAAADLDICPDEIVGDLDTVDPSLFDVYQGRPGIELEIHRPEKDETDTELALLTAERKGFRLVHLLGALGGRMDHALGNVQLLNQCFQNGVRAEIYDEKNKIYLAGPGKTEFFRKQAYGRYISFLPLTETVDGLTLTGFKYPLSNKTIHLGTSLCISNELTGEKGSLEFQKGILICFESHD